MVNLFFGNVAYIMFRKIVCEKRRECAEVVIVYVIKKKFFFRSHKLKGKEKNPKRNYLLYLYLVSSV